MATLEIDPGSLLGVVLGLIPLKDLLQWTVRRLLENRGEIMMRLLEDRDLALERARNAHDENGSELILDAMARRAAFAQARYNSALRTSTRRENVWLTLFMGSYLAGMALLIADVAGWCDWAWLGWTLIAVSFAGIAGAGVVMCWRIKKDFSDLTGTFRTDLQGPQHMGSAGVPWFTPAVMLLLLLRRRPRTR